MPGAFVPAGVESPMNKIDCGRYVRMGLIGGLVAWFIFIATLAYAALFIPEMPVQGNQVFTPRGGFQAGGFIAGWWLAIAALAACVLGYIREYKGPVCLLGVVPAALYVANPFSVMVFVKFVGN
jgi:hypothetical protein